VLLDAWWFFPKAKEALDILALIGAIEALRM
jgi:hypothetical protein